MILLKLTSFGTKDWSVNCCDLCYTIFIQLFYQLIWISSLKVRKVKLCMCKSDRKWQFLSGPIFSYPFKSKEYFVFGNFFNSVKNIKRTALSTLKLILTRDFSMSDRLRKEGVLKWTSLSKISIFNKCLTNRKFWAAFWMSDPTRSYSCITILSIIQHALIVSRQIDKFGRYSYLAMRNLIKTKITIVNFWMNFFCTTQILLEILSWTWLQYVVCFF